jgi:hypothetical protein
MAKAETVVGSGHFRKSQCNHWLTKDLGSQNERVQTLQNQFSKVDKHKEQLHQILGWGI